MTPWTARATSARMWGMSLALAVFLTVVTAADIWVSGLFFDTDTAQWVQRGPVLQFMRSGMPPLIIGGLLFVLLVWLGARITSAPVWDITGCKIGYLIISLIAGPGLIVESILKSWSGRARPRDVDLFGGGDAFTPALWLGDACEKNCSFVSGHAALGFWTTAFAFLLPAEARTPAFAGGVAVGILMGLARMAEGAHFFSDIVYAGVIVVGLNVWLARKLIPSAPSTETGDGA